VSERVVLVTGASRGLGRGIVEGLTNDDTIVIGLARSPLEEWDRPDAAGFEPHRCDVTDESQVKRLFSDIRKRHGRLDLVVNNAGAFSAQVLLSASGDRFSDLLRSNLVSAHLITREAVKLMAPKRSGRVVSISSIAAAIPMTGNALYASTKLALEALMRSFAVEFRGSGITFNSVAVSFLESTGMVDALRPEARASYEARLLVPAPLHIDEIVQAVCYFASPEARSVTGQLISLGSPN
jgi:3-oxoacyl-[acyl-carrier protein] reductase